MDEDCQNDDLTDATAADSAKIARLLRGRSDSGAQVWIGVDLAADVVAIQAGKKMYATDSTFVVEPEDGKEGSRPLQAVITVVWALLATLLLFAFMGAIALVVI